MKIGILALQGAFREHNEILKIIDGMKPFYIRSSADLGREMDGIILPGGESTVMGKLLQDFCMLDDLRNLINNGLPAFGTCAGMILLSDNPDESVIKLSTFPAQVKRNAFGRQSSSYQDYGNFGSIGEISMVFIRAPIILSVAPKVQILSKSKGKIVAAKYKKQLITAFHPELTNNSKVHEYFINMISQ